tara:strand:+ start:206 stop:892 length:687 start_codon:yes stop_codon:yes gene_type:complete
MSDDVMVDGVEGANQPTQDALADSAQETNGKVFSQTELEKIIEQRLARERKKFEKQIDGIDISEARKLMEEKEVAEIERQKERGEFEAILKKTAEKKDSQINTLTQRLQQTLVDGALLTAASQSNAVNPDQVVSLVKAQTRLAEDGQVEVVDTNGSVRYNDSGDPLSVKDLVSDFLTANPHFVRASPSGVGSQGAAGGSTQKPDTVAKMVATWETGGRDAFAALKGKR